MKKGILSGIITFFVLLGVLFVGMLIGDEFSLLKGMEEGSEEGEEVVGEGDYEPFLEHEQMVINVIEENLPAVVSIVASKYVEYLDFPQSDFFFFQEPETKERLQTEEGTGFMISEDGFILTNEHVVGDKNAAYTVFLSTGEEKEAQVVARDPLQDLAVLKIEGDDFPTVTIGDSDTVRPGQTAIAIGNALGEFQNTASVGIISGIGRRVVARGEYTAEVLDDVIQTDAAINFGNSGGPLLNLKGEVIGVNTATTVRAEGIGFALPINRARRAMEGAKEDGKIVYPFLGVHYVIVDSEIKREEDLPVDYGAFIISGRREESAVVSGSAAEEAGIKEGDIILEFEEEKITKNNSLAMVITKYNPGDTVEITILRDGEEKILEATLGEID